MKIIFVVELFLLHFDEPTNAKEILRDEIDQNGQGGGFNGIKAFFREKETDAFGQENRSHFFWQKRNFRAKHLRFSVKFEEKIVLVLLGEEIFLREEISHRSCLLLSATKRNWNFCNN
jgi:hypothetical protein